MFLTSFTFKMSAGLCNVFNVDATCSEMEIHKTTRNLIERLASLKLDFHREIELPQSPTDEDQTNFSDVSLRNSIMDMFKSQSQDSFIDFASSYSNNHPIWNEYDQYWMSSHPEVWGYSIEPSTEKSLWQRFITICIRGSSASV